MYSEICGKELQLGGSCVIIHSLCIVKGATLFSQKWRLYLDSVDPSQDVEVRGGHLSFACIVKLKEETKVNFERICICIITLVIQVYA